MSGFLIFGVLLLIAVLLLVIYAVWYAITILYIIK